MKAIYFEQHGERDVLRYGDLPAPTPGPGEVRVEIRAAALNQLDIWVRRGWPGLKHAAAIGGSDGAGIVAELGPGVSGVSAGDRVGIDPGISTRVDEWTRRGLDSVSPGYQILGEHRAGTFAEQVVVPAANLLPIPAAMGFAEACAPQLVAVTAWRMLIVAGQLKAGRVSSSSAREAGSTRWRSRSPTSPARRSTRSPPVRRKCRRQRRSAPTRSSTTRPIPSGRRRS